LWIGKGGGGENDGFTGVESGQLRLVKRLRNTLGAKTIEVRVSLFEEALAKGVVATDDFLKSLIKNVSV